MLGTAVRKNPSPFNKRVFFFNLLHFRRIPYPFFSKSEKPFPTQTRIQTPQHRKMYRNFIESVLFISHGALCNNVHNTACCSPHNKGTVPPRGNRRSVGKYNLGSPGKRELSNGKASIDPPALLSGEVRNMSDQSNIFSRFSNTQRQ